MSGGWIEWTGGACPVDPCTVVDVQLRDREQRHFKDGRGLASDLGWEHTGVPYDVIRYRVVETAPKAVNADGWIDWPGGECPVDPDVVVDYAMRAGVGMYQEPAGNLRWRHEGGPWDIVQYRVVTPARSKTEPIRAALDTLKPSTNPKDAIGSVKLPLHLWPAEATALGCLGMLEGMLKYGRNNYIAGDGIIASIYVDAAKRHLDAWFSCEENSPDSGVPHLANALATIAIIVKAQANGKLIDDRDYAPTKGYRKLVDSITPHVKRLQALFADKKPKHYTIADNPKED